MSSHRFRRFVGVLGLLMAGPWALAQKSVEPRAGLTGLRLPGGSIVAVHAPPASRVAQRMQTQAAQAPAVAWPYARVPLDGFLPLVAVSVTNYRASVSQDNWEHLLTTTYQGAAIHPPASQNYLIAIFDSGSVADLIGYCDSSTAGLTGSWLSENTIELSGVSGAVEAPITYPVGIFAAGLSAIQPNGQLDTTKLVGHGNVAAVVGPPEDCGEPFVVPSVVGNVMAGFFTTVIRVDQPRSATFAGVTYTAPEVQIKSLGSPPGIAFTNSIRMNVSGPSLIATSAYFPDILNSENPDQPWFPTLLATSNGSLPLGGGFFAQMGVLQGEGGPTNPLQTMRVLVDTGAQSCIMTPGMASNLNLPLDPDFTMDIQGIGGVLEDVPGYFIDYVKINAAGGALEFSHVPFIVLDVPSPDGQAMDGILGMNMFWNRNVIFDPRTQTDGALKVSAPVLAKADFDRDTDVDGDDLGMFLDCFSGPAVPQPDLACLLEDLDGDLDVDAADFGIFQRCYSGSGQLAIATCAN